ncbi:hypothetical protein KSS87_008187 [Heliosperma pusillum]|nr:hypothetical protein KSS87_008187 [Heliosperma pusillum]
MGNNVLPKPTRDGSGSYRTVPHTDPSCQEKKMGTTMHEEAEKISVLIKAANITVDSFWPALFAKLLEKKNVEDLISTIGAGGGGGGAAPAAVGGGGAAAPAAEEKKEEKEEAKEESDDDMGFGLFD